MKIRNGFVSNSSSSSFIVHGVQLSLDESSNLFDGDNYWNFSRDNNLCIEQDRFYFGGDLEGYIVGVNGGDFEDGQVTKIKNLTEDDKEKIVEKLKSVGIEKTVEDVNIYIQFISNDNY
jgi:hypothetical protein